MTGRSWVRIGRCEHNVRLIVRTNLEAIVPRVPVDQNLVDTSVSVSWRKKEDLRMKTHISRDDSHSDSASKNIQQAMYTWEEPRFSDRRLSQTKECQADKKSNARRLSSTTKQRADD
jgi:hypothetical protein